MIDIEKVRLWSVEFIVQNPIEYFPIPARIVMERETAGYQILGTRPPLNQYLHGGQLTITLSGKGQFHAKNFSHTLLPGDAFLYRIADPDVSYYSPPDAREPWSFLWVHFDGMAAEKLITDLNRRYGYLFDVSENKELLNMLQHYQSWTGKTFFLHSLEAAKWAMDFFELLCRNQERNRAVEPAAKLSLQAQRLIAEDLGQSWNASRIARKLAVSREHLCKVFKAETNQTIHDYQKQKRLELAVELLTKTTLSYKEIMMRCGFGSYSSFYRTVCRCYGRAPELFRYGGQPQLPGN